MKYANDTLFYVDYNEAKVDRMWMTSHRTVTIMAVLGYYFILPPVPFDPYFEKQRVQAWGIRPLWFIFLLVTS